MTWQELEPASNHRDLAGGSTGSLELPAEPGEGTSPAWTMDWERQPGMLNVTLHIHRSRASRWESDPSLSPCIPDQEGRSSRKDPRVEHWGRGGNVTKAL